MCGPKYQISKVNADVMGSLFNTQPFKIRDTCIFSQCIYGLSSNRTV